MLVCGCSTTEYVPEPYPVPQYVPLPAALTQPCTPVAIPEVVTYGDLVEYHVLDRVTLADCNRRMEEIRNARPD